jgi:tetratricopeptide (TPR) repeat protein
MMVRSIILFVVAMYCGSAGADDAAADAQLVYAYEVFLSADPSGPESAGIWLKLGNIHLRRSRFDEARDAYRHVVSLGDQARQAQMTVAGKLGIGLTYSRESRYREAADYLTGVVGEVSGGRPSGNLVSVYRELANVSLHTENYADVVEYGRRAMEAYHALDSWEDEALMLLVIGVAHAENGALTDAETALRKSYRLFNGRGGDDLSHVEQAGRVIRIARGYGIQNSDW